MLLVEVIRAATATPASALNLRDESGAYTESRSFVVTYLSVSAHTYLSISAHTTQSDYLLMHALIDVPSLFRASLLLLRIFRQQQIYRPL